MIEINLNEILLVILIFFKDILIISLREKIAFNLNIFDYPNKRKIHSKPTPLIGGLCFFTTLIILAFYHFLGNFKLPDKFIIMYLMFIIFFFTGFTDDKSQLSPKKRTIIILLSILIVLSLEESYLVKNLSFISTSRNINLEYLHIVFTIFCIFALYNALNFIDGVNGVAISISIFWILFLLLNNFNYFYFACFLTLLVIFVFNLQGKIFLGNSGTSILSIFFSINLINDYNNKMIFADEIMFLLFLPGIDMIRVTILRIKNKKKIYNADNSHFHHYLNKLTPKYVWQIILFLTILPILFLYIFDSIIITLIISFIIYLMTLKFIKIKIKSNA